MIDHLLWPAIALFILYCLGRFLPPVGEAYATTCTVAAKVLQQLHERLERSPEKEQHKLSSLALIARLVGLVVGLAVLFGEGIGSYVASSALFGSEISTNQLPSFGGLATLSLAVLLFSLSAVFGNAMLEMVEIVPVEARILNVPQSKRKALQWIVGICLLISLLAMACFWCERAFDLQNTTADFSDLVTILQVTTLVLIGLLVIPGAVLALWLAVVGAHALTQIVRALLAFTASALLAVAEVLGRHFSRSDYSLKQGGNSMKGKLKDGANIAMYGLGDFGVKMLLAEIQALRDQHAEDLVVSTGAPNFHEGERSMAGIGEWVTVTDDEYDKIAEGVRIKSNENTEERIRKEVCARFGARINDAVRMVPSRDACILFFIDPEELALAIDMLTQLRHDLGDHRPIAVVTQLDTLHRKSAEVRKALQDVRELWQNQVITTTFVFSNPSNFTKTTKQSGGESKQMACIAYTIASLILAKEDNPMNRSCARVLKDLGRVPFLAGSFYSTRLSPQRVSQILRMLSIWVRGEDPVIGDQRDICTQLQRVADQAITDEDLRASEYLVDEASRAVILCTVPLRPRDPRFELVHDALANFLAREHGHVFGLLVRGKGVPLDVASVQLDQFYVFAAYFAPLRENPFEDEMPELVVERAQPTVEKRGTVRTVVVPRIATANGTDKRS